MAKYDFIHLRADKAHLIHNGCIWRRFIASFIDTLFIGVFCFPFALDKIEILWKIDGSQIIVYLFIILYICPELIFRQSFGMFCMNLIVIPPLGRLPIISILIRKFLNFIELIMPSIIFYWLTAMNKDFLSLSDLGSGCIIARKAIIERKINIKNGNIINRILCASIFTFTPIIIIIFIFIILLILEILIQKNFMFGVCPLKE